MRRGLAGFLATLLLAACSQPALPPGHGRIDHFEAVELAAGSGAVAQDGDRVSVHYTGWLYDDREPEGRGAQFDSSRERGEPIVFVLGARQVIRGWDEGLRGMQVGGRRLLRLPAEYGYGERGAGGVIPPGAALLFEVELLGTNPT